MLVLGNLGQDPELKYLPSGAAVCSISVATSRSWKNKESGEKMEETEWHRVTFFDRLAEIAGEYLSKGDPVFVEGRLKTRKWQDKDGNDRYTTEIIAESMQLLGGRKDGGGQQGQQAPQQRQQPQQGSRGGNSAPPAPAQRPQQRQAAPQRGGGSTPFEDMDSDIPFLVNLNGVSIASPKARRLGRARVPRLNGPFVSAKNAA